MSTDPNDRPVHLIDLALNPLDLSKHHVQYLTIHRGQPFQSRESGSARMARERSSSHGDAVTGQRRVSHVLQLVPHLHQCVAPSSATAQSNQPHVVRASTFEVVADDGAVLARLTRGSVGGGNLMLYDAAGVQRTGLTGSGALVAFDPEGVLVFRAGRTFEVGGSGTPPVNGVELSPGGSVGMLPTQP